VAYSLGFAALVIAIGLYTTGERTEVRATGQNRSTLEERNAAEMQEAARRRKLIELTELRKFRDNGRDVFDLAQDLLVITNSPIDAPRSGGPSRKPPS
jgi:hypothetical protein